MISEIREWIFRQRVRYKISKLSRKTSVQVKIKDIDLNSEKNFIMCLGRFKSTQLCDKNLVIMLITAYISENCNKQGFKKKYRDAELIYKNTHKEVFKKFDEIIISSELFK